MPERTITPLATVPDSALCRAATDLLVATSDPRLVAHCYRTHAFGSALVGDRPCDPEVLFVAAALHDLGLTDAHADDDVPGFEHIGAQAAAELVARHTGDDARAALAADAVRLHLELTAARDARAEVVAVSTGAAVDVLGMRLDRLPAGLLDHVLERWPRNGFASWLTATLASEAQRRPASTIARYVRDHDFLRHVGSTPLDAPAPASGL